MAGKTIARQGARAGAADTPASTRPAPRFDDFMGQSAHIERLREDFARGSYVHAYLFAGPRGTGKRSVAVLCAAAAVCRGENRPCGVCGPCRRALSGTHPDIHTVLPEKDKKSIGVDAMREVIEEVSVRSFEDGAKALIFPRAELLTAAAQNALLKTLEEPPEGTVFFLCTDQPAALLPTIVSRCRVVRFHPLSVEDAQKRLVALGEEPARAHEKARMAEGCVGQALEIDGARLALRYDLTRAVFSIRSAGDIPAVVALFKDDRERQTQAIDVLEGAVRDILLAQSGAVTVEGAGYAPEAEAYARVVPLPGGLTLFESITDAKKMLASNVAFASAFETILLKVSEEYQKWPW